MVRKNEFDALKAFTEPAKTKEALKRVEDAMRMLGTPERMIPVSGESGKSMMTRLVYPHAGESPPQPPKTHSVVAEVGPTERYEIDTFDAWIGKHETVETLYDHIDRLNWFELSRMQRRNTPYYEQQAWFRKKAIFPGCLKPLVARVRRALSVIRAELRNDIPTLHVEDIIK